MSFLIVGKLIIIVNCRIFYLNILFWKEIVSRTEKEEAKGELLADTVHTLLRVTSAERARYI